MKSTRWLWRWRDLTSAACPVAFIIDDVGTELDKVAPAEMAMDVELVWEPPWTTDRMSARPRPS
jgi:metal-sulfur cluster biosynthetic enzyme